jgi:maleylpyruvate isomerase
MPELEELITGCTMSHRRLRHTLGQLDDDNVRQPSRLPDWTIGHVVTHLARNADSHVRILEGAMAGEHLEQYEGGPEQRTADIEAGAGRDAGSMLDDMISAFVRLEETWERMTPQAWEGWGLSRGNVWPCRQLPFARWREVEVHHVDLGFGYETSDWPEDYVALELSVALSGLLERLTDTATRNQVLGWLIGRAAQPASLELGPWRPGPLPGTPPTGSAL